MNYSSTLSLLSAYATLNQRAFLALARPERITSVLTSCPEAPVAQEGEESDGNVYLLWVQFATQSKVLSQLWEPGEHRSPTDAVSPNAGRADSQRPRSNRHHPLLTLRRGHQ